MAISPDGLWIYVANYNGNSITVVNTTTFTIAKTIIVGAGPVGVAFDSYGNLAAVANNSANTITLIDVPTHSVITTIPTVGTGPYYLEYSPEGQLIVGLGGEANILRINHTTLNIKKIPTATNPNAVAFSPNGLLLYAIARTTSKISIINY